MCVADAAHDNKIIENVQNLQARGQSLMNDLTVQIQNISDCASVEICKRTCKKAIEEMEQDILNVATEIMSKGDISSKSTVKNCSRFL
jgi:acetolactate synthase regulatory subunit